LLEEDEEDEEDITEWEGMIREGGRGILRDGVRGEGWSRWLWRWAILAAASSR
jgi:hypothetical protein